MNISPLILFDLLALLFIAPLFVTTAIMSRKNVRTGAALLKETCLPMGILGTLIGTMHMLQDLSDPTAIGPAFAVALLTMLYGFVIYSLLPYAKHTEGDKNQAEKIPTTHHWGPDAVGLVVLFTAILSAMAYNGALKNFLDLVSVICVVLFTIVPTMLYSDPEHNLIEGKLIAARNYALTTAIIAIIIGFTGFFAELDSPVAYGPYLAIALLTSIYCGIIIISSTLLYRSRTASQIPHFLSYTIAYVVTSIMSLMLFGLAISFAFDELF